MKRILLLALLVLTATFGVSAQENSRQVIRDAIKATGKCYNVAITKTKGDAALFGYWCEISNCADLASEYYDMEETAFMASYYFDEEAGTASVSILVTMGDGSTETDNTEYKKVDGKWRINQSPK